MKPAPKRFESTPKSILTRDSRNPYGLAKVTRKTANPFFPGARSTRHPFLPGGRPYRVVIIESQDLFRHFLSNLCNTSPGLELVGTSRTIKQAETIVREVKPDLITLDVDLADGDGLDLAERLQEALPRLRILILTSVRDEITVQRLKRLKIPGYLDKETQTPETLLSAILRIASGKTFHSAVFNKVHQTIAEDPLAVIKLLTKRELELMSHLAAGLSERSTAAKMKVTMTTLHAYKRRMMKKLGFSSYPEFLHFAVQKGFFRKTFLQQP